MLAVLGGAAALAGGVVAATAEQPHGPSSSSATVLAPIGAPGSWQLAFRDEFNGPPKTFDGAVIVFLEELYPSLSEISSRFEWLIRPQLVQPTINSRGFGPIILRFSLLVPQIL